MIGADLKIDINNGLDDYSFPNQPDDILSVRIDRGISKFIEDFYPVYQSDEKARQVLSLLKVDVNPVAGLQIVFNPTYKDVRYTTIFNGYFKNPCTGNYDLREIRPLKDDTKGTVLTDSFAKPDNYDPRYELTGNGITRIINIFADSAPNKIDWTYIKNPVKTDLVNSPNQLIEIPDGFQKELADLVIRMIMGIEEDSRYPVQEFEMTNK